MMNLVHVCHFKSDRSMATENNNKKVVGITLGKNFPCFNLKNNFPNNEEEKENEVTVMDGCQNIGQLISVLHQLASISLK